MKDEIKEMFNIIECWKNGDYVLAYSFNYDRAGKQNNKILDYITNLQKENKHLNLQLDQALKDYEELQQRIDKATEYIKHFSSDEICENITGIAKILLEILGDKEQDIELDVLKALNTDLDDDVEMG